MTINRNGYMLNCTVSMSSVQFPPKLAVKILSVSELPFPILLFPGAVCIIALVGFPSELA